MKEGEVRRVKGGRKRASQWKGEAEEREKLVCGRGRGGRKDDNKDKVYEG